MFNPACKKSVGNEVALIYCDADILVLGTCNDDDLVDAGGVLYTTAVSVDAWKYG